ncbi:MAG: hypothetical protein O7G86_14485 [Gammaproteobacteria bacterium]|nr:hypothetical protein [Gammaproteobacteria bacterium]
MVGKRVGFDKLATLRNIVISGALLTPLVALSETDIPRTADGRPDLSGTYDVATLTPLRRPARLADRLTLTDEEAEEVARYWKNNLDKDRVPSDPDREAPPEGGTDFFIPEINGAAGRVGGYNAFYIDLGDSNFKIDGMWRTSIITDPANGQMPPLSDAGKQRMTAFAGFGHENTGTAWWIDQDTGPYDDPELRPLGERCLLGFGSTSGPPMLPVMYNNLKKIVQTEDYLMILVEMNHDARIIRINAEHAPSDVRKWLGDSVGQWEGDTLVVDTTNFREQSGFSMASRDLHVVERFSRLDADTVLYQFTVDDPTWTESWSGEYPWPASDGKVYEYACHEGNYALGGILRGARVLEQDVIAGTAAGAED